jgi:predicted metal-dependent enzyme (double-stranded beta helix superfamily)
MFDKDRFVETCSRAVTEHNPQLAIKEIVERAVSEPSQVERALGPITEGGIQTLYHSSELTILHFLWAPSMVLYPHNHQMWAIIGIYGGQEDNIFYRRRKEGVGLERINGRSLRDGDVISLGDQAIHAVSNPLRRLTAAIHVYGGDFFAAPRSEWPSETAPEKPFDFDGVKRVFAKANERAREILAKKES